MKLSFAHKLWLPLLVALLSLAGSLFFGSVTIKDDQLALRKKELVYVSQLALNVVKTQAALVDKGLISKEEAQQRAIQIIKDLRYGDTGYFTILNTQAQVIMHPINAALIGKGPDIADANGVYIFRDMVAVTKDGHEGFTAYDFPRPGDTVPKPKIAYNIPWPSWGWIITTGLYVDDIQEVFLNSLYQNTAQFIAISILLSVLVYLINRSTLKTLGGEPRYAAEVVSRISAGDLSQTVNKKANDNSSLLHEMGIMREQLTSVIEEIRDGAEMINTNTQDIVAGNQEIAGHTDQQAMSLEKTSSSMEEITAAVKQNAEHAGQARELARGAVDIASRGGVMMQNVNDTMNGISESAGKIANIIDVVNSIAFQTNILALNAAVEAARAGEQGKGFAVVASEVRNLSLRSSQAAQEIKELIEESVSRVNSGSSQIKIVGDNIDEMIEAVQRVSDIMSQISVATDEQSIGISQVNEAIVQIDSVTHQNTQLVQQAVAAANALEKQTRRLTQTVAFFTTGR
ncbi:methyl-accepting chemotaxis sensory transducer with Cache sensor [Kosakonia arachidis]|uniref:Methyl-accepting chemotaxis sensory transducer with Cache sensor n=1 Tax=Kosakonia arachidis TaxID=551989 RepID=A0A1I7C863_9ENTR|nr:methyl-accepting chemotaxis protein [Kosakonia arachidis]SFT95623.1 methyl-accepting chemotaxis sensory transducer with Cache sensor [Kosakonia arachidis]